MYLTAIKNNCNYTFYMIKFDITLKNRLRISNFRQICKYKTFTVRKHKYNRLFCGHIY